MRLGTNSVNLQAGQIARVRTRKYLIEEVVLPPVAGDQTLVRLACLEDDAQGQPLEVLWEREVDAKVLDDASWRKSPRKDSIRRTSSRRTSTRFTGTVLP